MWVRIISFLGLVVIDRHACQLAGARCCTSQSTRRGCKIEAVGRGDQCRRNEKLLLHDPNAGVIVELSLSARRASAEPPQGTKEKEMKVTNCTLPQRQEGTQLPSAHCVPAKAAGSRRPPARHRPPRHAAVVASRPCWLVIGSALCVLQAAPRLSWIPWMRGRFFVLKRSTSASLRSPRRSAEGNVESHHRLDRGRQVRVCGAPRP